MAGKGQIQPLAVGTLYYLYIDPMAAPDKTNYARSLFERLDQGLVVPLRPVRIEHDEGTWEPKAQQCHHNASVLGKTYPNDLEIVRGWLVFDFRSVFGEVRFMHHSVIKEKATGLLFDPTPQERLNPDYLFIVADLVETDYEELVEGMVHGEMLSYRAL
jgi:hypothetical protein